MKIAILESIVMPAGHEVEFDRILVEEMKNQGHEPIFFVPEKYPFKLDYHAKIDYLSGGEAISYAGVSKLKKIYLSIVREKRRVAWFDSACEKAQKGLCDAIIVPTSSWRGMRSLRNSKLKNSPVPVLFMMHGIMPSDRKRFVDGVRSLKQYRNVHVAALGMQTEFPELSDCPNFHTILPPVYIPMDLGVKPEFEFHEPLRLGFFGQYRREKKLEDFLEAYINGSYTRPVKLMVQGATMHPEDSADFKRIIKKYSGREDIEFLHKGLIGAQWQEKISEIDALLLPYSAKRYLYHWGGMLFTAIGFKKPVVTSDDMNPEVFELFHIGETFASGNLTELKRVLESFVNGFDANVEIYKDALDKASEEFSPEMFARRVEAIIKA